MKPDHGHFPALQISRNPIKHHSALVPGSRSVVMAVRLCRRAERLMKLERTLFSAWMSWLTSGFRHDQNKQQFQQVMETVDEQLAATPVRRLAPFPGAPFPGVLTSILVAVLTGSRDALQQPPDTGSDASRANNQLAGTWGACCVEVLRAMLCLLTEHPTISVFRISVFKISVFRTSLCLVAVLIHRSLHAQQQSPGRASGVSHAGPNMC